MASLTPSRWPLGLVSQSARRVPPFTSRAPSAMSLPDSSLGIAIAIVSDHP